MRAPILRWVIRFKCLTGDVIIMPEFIISVTPADGPETVNEVAGDDSTEPIVKIDGPDITRELVAEEERAAIDYEEAADKTDCDKAKAVYKEIAGDEKAHAGQLFLLLLGQDPEEREAREKGEEELEENIGPSFREIFESKAGEREAKCHGDSEEIEKARKRRSKADQDAIDRMMGRKDFSGATRDASGEWHGGDQTKPKHRKGVGMGTPDKDTPHQSNPTADNMTANASRGHERSAKDFPDPEEYQKEYDRRKAESEEAS